MTEQAAYAVVINSHRHIVMSSNSYPPSNPDQPTSYQIRIKGHLGSEWADWFEGMAVTLEDSGETLLTGSVTDQAALHGLLKKVRDLGLPLLSVNRMKSGQANMPDANQ
jgi:hypothetical protein